MPEMISNVSQNDVGSRMYGLSAGLEGVFKNLPAGLPA